MWAGGQYKENKMIINKKYDYKQITEKDYNNIYSVRVKAVHVKTDKYDFIAYKLRTSRGKWIDIWISYYEEFLTQFINENKEVTIEVEKGFISYSINDKGFYISSLNDWYAAEKFIDKTEDKQ